MKFKFRYILFPAVFCFLVLFGGCAGGGSGKQAYDPNKIDQRGEVASPATVYTSTGFHITNPPLNPLPRGEFIGTGTFWTASALITQ